MRIVSTLFIALFLSLAGSASLATLAQDAPKAATEKPKPIVVTGTLNRMMAIGAESTGWAIEMDSPMDIEGKQVHTLEIMYGKMENMEKWEHQRVTAKGTLDHMQGVETGSRLVLHVATMKPAKDKPKS